MRQPLPIILTSCLLVLLLSGCAALTGIPGHGGGKRFAVEQELVSAATRSAIMQINLATIRGRKVNLYVNAIGDTGAGNVVGGRFSIISQLHGDYVQTPPVQENYIYPRYDSTSTVNSTESSSTNQSSTSTSQFGSPTSSRSRSDSTSSTSQTSASSTMLPAPISKTARQQGGGATAQLGMEYKGLGSFHNSEEITSDDLQYLSALMQTYLFLQGVHVAPPSEAEVDVYITVDVFGTVYTRVDWFLANNEILKARTALEVFAVDTASGEVLMPPQSAGAESEYNEQYILWAGPVSIRKSVRKADPLLTDFSEVVPEQTRVHFSYKEEQPATPFQHRQAKRRANKKW